MRPCWWSLQRFHKPPSWILKGLLLTVGTGMRRMGKEKRGRSRKGGESVPSFILQFHHCTYIHS